MIKSYEVGRSYEEFKGRAEGAVFDMDDSGAVLLVYFNRPTANEIDQFKENKRIEIRFVPINDFIVLTCKIGDLNWMDMPYTPHKSKHLTHLEIPEEGYGISLTLILIDTSSGKIENLRLLGLSTDFSRKLMGAIMEEKMKDFDDNNFNRNINCLLNKYTTKEFVKMSTAYCKIN